MNQFDIEYAKNPVRVNKSSVDLTVKFLGIPEEMEFTAHENDSEEHGRILYQNAINGFYGAIVEQEKENG